MSVRDAGLLLGVPIDRKDLATATAEALVAIDRRSAPIVFACANAHSLQMAQQDPQFKSALTNAGLVVADGVGVTAMARFAGVRIGPRITGHDYFLAILNALKKRGGARVFFFGSSPVVLSLISEKFAQDFPTLRLCGVLSPPFRDWSAEENRAMVARINEARPDVLWVGMTAPKQEKWVATNCRDLDVPVIGSIGAVFDFYAGTQPRAPQWMRRMGMEWVYRLAREPRRMWHRYLVSSARFVALVVWRHVFNFGIKI